MPSLDLFVEGVAVSGLPPGGTLLLDPPVAGLGRVLLRRLSCLLRAPPVPGAYRAVIDTGAPLTIIPHDLWQKQFGWRAGREYDELSVAGVGPVLRSQTVSYRYTCRLARLRVPVELAGSALAGPRLRLDSLVALLADTGGPPYIILGLWGNALEGRKIALDRRPGSDELMAALEY